MVMGLDTKIFWLSQILEDGGYLLLGSTPYMDTCSSSGNPVPYKCALVFPSDNLDAVFVANGIIPVRRLEVLVLCGLILALSFARTLAESGC